MRKIFLFSTNNKSVPFGYLSKDSMDRKVSDTKALIQQCITF